MELQPLFCVPICEIPTWSFGITEYDSRIQCSEMKFAVRIEIPILIGSKIMMLEKTYKIQNHIQKNEKHELPYRRKLRYW
jgi:hypothetical protein